MAAIDPAIPAWPLWLCPQDINIALVSGAVSGPQPLAGAPQSAQSSIGHLQFTLSDVPIFDRQPGDDNDRLMAFRWLYFDRLAMGLPIYVPVWDCGRGPRKRAGLPVGPQLVPFSDGALFSDGASFSQDVTDAVVAVDADAGDVSIVIDALTAAVPQSGDPIGLGDRIHFVRRAVSAASPAGRWTLTISPPLREAQTAGARVEVANPVCIMKLAESDRARGWSMNLNRSGRVSLTFLEANWTA